MPKYGSDTPSWWEKARGKRTKDIYLPNETGMLDPELEQFDTPAKKTKRFFESNAAVLQGLKKAAENPSPALQKYRQKPK